MVRSDASFHRLPNLVLVACSQPPLFREPVAFLHGVVGLQASMYTAIDDSAPCDNGRVTAIRGRNSFCSARRP